MLINFRFKNFKSYKDLQTFNMVAGSTKSKEERLFIKDDLKLVKFSALYGANGSGKSNAVEAMEVMKEIILKGFPKNPNPVYFKLDESCIKIPTYFEMILLIDNDVFSYGFEFLSAENKIVSEWLTKLNGSKEKDIFNRTIDIGKYDFNPHVFKDNKDKIKVYLDDFKQNNETLFLSYLNANKNSAILKDTPCIKKIFDWFHYKLTIAEPESILTSGDYFRVTEKIEKLSNLLRMFDTGIKSVDKVEVSKEIASSFIPFPIMKDIEKDIEKNKNNKEIESFGFLLRNKSQFWSIECRQESAKFYKICFYHDEKGTVPFNVKDESEGTIRIMDLAEILLTDEKDKLFIIDELDRKLHPQLTCKFVNMFLENCVENNNQLIVTTHESRLLDFNILRRDEIWFANKNKEGVSELYSLEEFNVRFDKKIDKAYLDGRYGGVPIFDNVFPTFPSCHESN